MATPQTLYAPTLGEEGEPCTQCGASLAGDQRYCLNCGHRRTEARLPFMDVLAQPAPDDTGGRPPNGPATAVAATPPGGPGRSVTPLAAVTAVSAVVVALAAGVVIGHQGDGSKSSKPQVVSVAGGQAATGTPTSSETFKGDWPSGKKGWTVQLQALPKSGTQASAVAAAKTAAQGKGAPSVGALDSDKYLSLAAGNFIVYSGVFDKQGDAQKALSNLKKNFPQAKVVQVSTDQPSAAAFNGKSNSAVVAPSQLQQLHNLSPSQYQKRSAKLPNETGVQGTPPPTDKKKAAGSNGATTVG